MFESLVIYLVGAMLAWVPLDHHAFARETPAETEARYWSIAMDVAEVALDPAEAPVFDDADARAETALLLVAVASYESAFAKRVDECKVGDAGRAWSIFQVQGHGRRALCGDRRAAARVALGMMRESFATCSRLGVGDRLGLYTDGRCRERWRRSRQRVGRALAWLADHPFAAWGTS